MTQGTVINSIRSKKYADCTCFGIMISARCDIANNKVQKFFYLEAVELKSWIFSEVGYNFLMTEKTKAIENKIQELCIKNELDWESLKNFSFDEFENVINTEIEIKNAKNQAIDSFKQYMHYSNDSLSIIDKRNILSKEKKSIINFLLNISNGKDTHFIYIPASAMQNQIEDGLVVDLQEIDYLDANTVKDLCNCLIDEKNPELDNEKKNYYDKRFVLSEGTGYSMEFCEIESPWIEYLLQHFSNMFVRIGVDNLNKSEITEIVEKILKEVD